MSALDTLLQVKTQLDRDDLIRLFDEMTAYEKIKGRTALLKNEKAMRKKFPLYMKAKDGDLYGISLLIILERMLAHLLETTPDWVTELTDALSAKKKKQMDVIAESIIPIEWDVLESYSPEFHGDKLLGVFAEPLKGRTAILILIKKGRTYTVFQGVVKETVKQKTQPLTPCVITKREWTLSVLTYSILGNNGYPFGTLSGKGKTFDVWMPSPDQIVLTAQTDGKKEIRLTDSEVAAVQMAKTNVVSFTDTLLDVIERHMEGENETAEGSPS